MSLCWLRDGLNFDGKEGKGNVDGRVCPVPQICVFNGFRRCQDSQQSTSEDQVDRGIWMALVGDGAKAVGIDVVAVESPVGIPGRQNAGAWTVGCVQVREIATSKVLKCARCVGVLLGLEGREGTVVDGGVGGSRKNDVDVAMGDFIRLSEGEKSTDK